MTTHTPGIPASYGLTRADYIKASGPFKSELTLEQRRQSAAEHMAHPELWEARVFYTDGSEQARTDFFLPRGSTEADAKRQAWNCWSPARVGDRYLNPTLVVRNVEAAGLELAA